MKAAILTQINAPLQIVKLNDIEKADLQFGQVLVKWNCAGICGAQLQELVGQKGNMAWVPRMLGHEASGVIKYVGPGVTYVKAGDHVVGHWRKGAGIDAAPAVYSGGVMAGPLTTFSEFSVVSENRVTKVPEELPADLGALFGCALSTALATIENVAKVKWGESVMVIGCGGVGLSLIYAATLAHAHPIVGVDQYDKSEWVNALGADFYLHQPPRLYESDVIIDTTGQAPLIEYLAPSGRYIMVGQPKFGSTLYVHGSQRMFKGEGLSITATQGGGFNPTRDIPRYVNLFYSGALQNYEKLISHRIKLDDINAGIKLIRDGEAARVMVYIS